jgi:phosphoribosylglycinamide formyltransferase 1
MAERARVAVLLSGRGSNMQALVAASRLPEASFEIVLVAGDKPDAPGIAWAAERGIATFAASPKGRPKAEYEAEIDAALRGARTEVIALAGYMRLLSPAFVAGWAGRILNIHPSLLPKYKGLDTHARAIAAGDAVAGASVHVVTEALDDGPVIDRAEVPILPGDTPATLAERVLAAEHRLYPAALTRFLADLPDRA